MGQFSQLGTRLEAPPREITPASAAPLRFAGQAVAPDERSAFESFAPWHLLTVVLCKEIATAPDHTPILYRLFSHAVADGLPFTHPFSVVVAWLFNEPGAYRIRVRLLSPDGRLSTEAEVEATIERPGTYHLVSFELGTWEYPLVFPLHGRYRVEVLLNGRSVSAQPFYVQKPGANDNGAEQ
jgi:hypothetical protein